MSPLFVSGVGFLATRVDSTAKLHQCPLLPSTATCTEVQTLTMVCYRKHVINKSKGRRTSAASSSPSPARLDDEHPVPPPSAASTDCSTPPPAAAPSSERPCPTPFASSPTEQPASPSSGASPERPVPPPPPLGSPPEAPQTKPLDEAGGVHGAGRYNQNVMMFCYDYFICVC